METNKRLAAPLPEPAMQQGDSEVASICQRIRTRSKIRKLLNYAPHSSCKKCGASAWEHDTDTVWYCFRCGNRGYWRGTGTERTFVQGGAYGA